jgi:hypothetical protein
MTEENEQEHAEQSRLDEAREHGLTTSGQCDLCGEQSIGLEPMLYHTGEKMMLCIKCWDNETARGDYLYEQMKENYDPNNPDHERDIKED